ncbi:MAG TPA: hypothetical protein VF297_30945 [Pyrinomonadaceae bacterium]
MSEEYDKSKGGGQWGEDDGPNVRYDDFVGRIVQDPNEPPNVMLLSGYLGSSSEEGHVRLYLDEELCRYVEIPQKAIRHSQELPPEQSPLGGSLVWIDRDAEVVHGAAGSERRKATFLEGQIAQDYIGGAGDYGIGGGLTTQTRDCRVGILPTDMGPGCGPSQLTPCIPQSQFSPCIPPTEIGCRTKTGIFCTRFGPGCRRTVFEPGCRTVLVHQCQSIYYPCFTQNKFDCVASGFVPCNPPIDFTIYEQYGQQQQQFAAQRPGGFGGGIGFPPPDTAPAICPSRTDLCSSRFIVSCQSLVPNECVAAPVTSFRFPCPPPPTGNCPISQFVRCDITRFCVNESVACGFDPQRGGGVAQQGFNAQAFAGDPIETAECGTRTQVIDCKVHTSQFINCPSAVDACPTRFNCPSAVDACPTRFNCPSRYSPCQSQYVRCPSALDACPTRFNCPTQPNGCPGYTRFGPCATYGPCPSAVDACPTRFGCDQTQVCQASQACGGETASSACQSRPALACGFGGGGFDPGGFGGGGFGGGF